MQKIIIDENLNDYDIALVALYQYYDRHHGHVSCYGKRLAMNSEPHHEKSSMVSTAIDEEGHMYKISFPVKDYIEEKDDYVIDWENYDVSPIEKAEWDTLNGTN